MVASLNHKELGKSQVPTLEVGDVIEADLWKSKLGKGAVRWRWRESGRYSLFLRDLAVVRALLSVFFSGAPFVSRLSCHLRQIADWRWGGGIVSVFLGQSSCSWVGVGGLNL